MYLNFFQNNIIIDLSKIVAFKCGIWGDEEPVIRFYNDFNDSYYDVVFESIELRNKQYAEIVLILMRDDCINIRQSKND